MLHVRDPDTPQALVDALPDGVVVADAEGRVVVVSAPAARMAAAAWRAEGRGR